MPDAPVSRVLGALCGAALLAAATPARGQLLRVWPDTTPPCNGTLQACVDAAGPDDGIEIETNGPIDETITIDSSIDLRAGLGFEPVFAAGRSILASVPETGNHGIILQGLTFVRGSIRVRHGNATGSLLVQIRDNRFDSISNTLSPIQILTTASGTLRFFVTGNEIEERRAATTSSRYAIVVEAGTATGSVEGEIARNVVHLENAGQGSAIFVGNGFADLELDAIGNVITGDAYNTGIVVAQFSEGASLAARIVNNVVSGQLDNSGAPGAVVVSASMGAANVTIVNNTLVFNDRGILLTGRPDLGATLTGVVANNLVAYNENGISLEASFEATLANEHNLVFANFINSFTPGPGTVTADPLLLGSALLIPQAGSPARDAGTLARLPGDILVDVAGNPRVVGATVDIGAYEVPEPASGAAGAAALAALLLRARRGARQSSV